MTSPIDGQVPYAAPPKHSPQVMGEAEWQQQHEAHQAWLASTRKTSAGEAGGGETESDQTGGNIGDETTPDTNPQEKEVPEVKKRQDSGKPGVFNVYATGYVAGNEKRVGEKIAAESPTDAIVAAQDSMPDPGNYINYRTTRLRGSSIKSKPTDTQPEQEPPQADDIILHRLQSAPLIGEDAENKIADIALAATSDTIKDGLGRVEKVVAQYAPAIDVAAVTKLIDERMKDLQPTITQIDISYTNGKTASLTGLFHPVFKQALHILSQREPVYLYGPSGTGKTFMAEQLAAALFPDMPEDERYYSLSATMGMSESHLQGWRLPISAGEFVYVPSEFVKRYENGGLFLLDEVDRADPNVLAVLNQALANNRMPLPARFEKPFARQHKDFVMMCGGNTAGTGADRLYTAATRLDEAFLDRFRPGTLYVDYDQTLEKALVGDTLLLKAMWRMREKTKNLRIERVISTRAIVKLHKLFDGTSQKGAINALKRLQTTWEPAEVTKVEPKSIIEALVA